MRQAVHAAIVLVLLLALSTTASALTIDNFEEGPFSVSDLVGETSGTQGGLSTLNVISGQRTVVVQSEGLVATTADLVLSLGDDAGDFSGDPGAAVSGLRLEYLFGSPFDLTQGGTLDRFEVEITAAFGTPELRFNIIDGASLFATPAAPITGAGTLTFLFSDFFLAGGPPAILDLTQVDELRVVGQVYGDFSVSNIAAVPEPSMALLLSMGLLGLAWPRR